METALKLIKFKKGYLKVSTRVEPTSKLAPTAREEENLARTLIEPKE